MSTELSTVLDVFRLIPAFRVFHFPNHVVRFSVLDTSLYAIYKWRRLRDDHCLLFGH